MNRCINCDAVPYMSDTIKFCCVSCKNEFENKKQKFEKIEKMAWEIYKLLLVNPREGVCTVQECRIAAWRYAKKFYNYTKEKEEKDFEK